MSTLTIRKVAGALGAEISGVDLGADLPDEVIAQIRQAFVQHQVVFFRDQHLSPEQQLAFGRRFGPLNIHPYVAGMEGHPEVMEIVKEPEDRVNFGGGWHSDMSFLEKPSIGSILYAVEIPEWGGDTLFASQAAAYDALSPGLKATLETLNGVHSAGREYSSQGHSAQERKTMKVVEAEGAVGEFIHPIVKVHPETGRKALYVNPGFTLNFEGWSREESAALLGYLYQHATKPQFVHRFQWKPGSMAIWDNRATWHLAMNDYQGQRRLMHRILTAPKQPRRPPRAA